MDEKEMVMEIADRLMLLESEVDALKTVIEGRPNASSRPQLDRKLFDLTSQIQNSQKYQQRAAEVRRVIETRTDPATLIQALHDEVLRRAEVS